MKVWIRILFAMAVYMMLAITAIAQDNPTELPSEGNIVVVDSAFIRSGPDNEYLPVGALFNGDEVIPVNISPDGNWILIPYSRGTGWIQRILVRWEDDAALDTLPVISANITPTPRVAITNTPFIPTATPEGNYINVEGAASAYVRAGPGRGYLRLGQLIPGDPVEPVARNEDTSWIMIRYSDDVIRDGFGWLAFELVYWEELDDLDDLPVVDMENLTPTPTFTASATPSATATSTDTPEPTTTETVVPTDTPEPTATETDVPTDTPEPTPTETDVPTDTPEPTPTETDVPTNTPEPTATETDVPTDTPEPTATETDVPTDTPEPTATDTEVVAAAIASTVTEESILSATITLTIASTPTDIFAIDSTSVAVESTAAPDTDNISEPPAPDILEETPDDNNGLAMPQLPVEAIVGAIILLIVLAYIWFYWQGLSAVGRYDEGFIIETCPVCGRGQLHVDQRPSRTLGIPGVRRTVRCDVCRSVLRETGTHRWRYAVDRLENPTMYDRFNGKHITDNDLERLGKTPPTGASARTSPEFVDADDQE